MGPSGFTRGLDLGVERLSSPQFSWSLGPLRSRNSDSLRSGRLTSTVEQPPSSASRAFTL